ncbi:metallophosphoesterase [Nocardia sp. NPDC005366]|uniref:metallophosphoesterase family protein n=1 Tax=Nocardia sp. NPDC005366 TaxID=3156878 RepID=UPI0033BD844B
MTAAVLAVSDLHIAHRGNRQVIERIRPQHPGDWLIVAGDVAEKIDDIRWALTLLRSRFDTVVWVPGNHELWTTALDPAPLRGVGRYEHLVEMCRDIGVVTPEDSYPVWRGAGGPVRLVPMMLLYDYTFLPAGAPDKAAGLRIARQRDVIAVDEHLLVSDPYSSVDDWCRARVAHTKARLDSLDPAVPLVLINHFPLVREPTLLMAPPEFGMWCGTELTADWHRAYNVLCAVYGHLHLPRTDCYDGVRFEEVSVGYPREWQRRGLPDPLLRRILPAPRGSHHALDSWGRRLAGRALRLADGFRTTQHGKANR